MATRKQRGARDPRPTIVILAILSLIILSQAGCSLSSSQGGTSPAVTVGLSPASVSLPAGHTQQFTATVSGSTDTAVTWSATGGNISPTGMYTAPSTAGSYVVKATSVADNTVTTSAAVTVTSVVSVSISPTSASVSTNGTQQFTAAVTGSSNTAVVWSATGGNVSSSGLYSAPATSGTYPVKATSAADNTKSASATVSVSVPVQHTVTLAWTASTSIVSGYNVYRSTTSGGAYTKINSVLEAATNYVDNTVQAGATYFYVVTSMNSSGMESAFSSPVTAVIPTP